jgi:hypothetical protein
LDPFPPGKANQGTQDHQEGNNRDAHTHLDGQGIKLYLYVVSALREWNHPEKVIPAQDIRGAIVYGRFPSRVMDFTQEKIAGILGRGVED